MSLPFRFPRSRRNRVSLPALLLPPLLLISLLVSPVAHAAIPFTAGPFSGQLWSDPATVAVGRARLFVELKDRAGKPLEGATVRVFAHMPAMPMGEKEEAAAPVAGRPEVWSAPAVFAMEGGYTVNISVKASGGKGSAALNVKSGQTLSPPGAASAPLPLMPILLGLAVLAAAGYTLYRMRRTGQRVRWSGVFSRGVVGELLLVVVLLAASFWIVRRYRPVGSMTPIEGQAMEMSTPAPPGVTAVTLATVERGPLVNTVRYSGSAVAFNEQGIYARVTGTLLWMPFYAGDRVKRGQLLARLDTSQIAPQIAERQAGVTQARQGVEVARAQSEQAGAEVHQAHGELSQMNAALDEAQANREAARAERADATATLDAAKTQVTDAEAALASAQAEQAYWKPELERMQTLVAEGAVSRDEFQKEQAQAKAADATVNRAQAGVAQAQAGVRAAQSRNRKANAMITAAGAKIEQARSELATHDAHVRATQAAADAARLRTEQAQTAVAQAKAGLAASTTTRDYSALRSEVDGVVTERLLSPGVLVSPGQAILRVAQIRPIRLQANVAEQDLARLRVGSPVTVRDRGKDQAAVVTRVTSVTPSVDPSARTGLVEALWPNADQRFLPGAFVEMSFTTAKAPDALIVPLRAVQMGIGADSDTPAPSTVWVAEPKPGDAGDYLVHAVRVTTGISDGDRTQITSGLKAGQRVVVAGAQSLADGETVRPASSEMARRPGSVEGSR